MADKKSNIKVFLIIFGVLFSYLMIFMILWIMKTSSSTIYLGIFLYTIVLLISYIIYLKVIKSRDDEDGGKKQKIQLLTIEESDSFIYDIIRKRSIVIKKRLCARNHKVKPETPDQSASYFRYMIVQDSFDYEYKFIYVNRKNLEWAIERKLTLFDNEEVKQILEDASESTRELIPVISKQYDAIGNVIGVQERYEKPRVKIESKEEARIGT